MSLVIIEISVLLNIIFFFVLIEKNRIIKRLNEKISMTNFPEIIKIKQDEAEKKSKIMDAELSKALKEGVFSLKVPRVALGKTARALTGNYISIHFEDITTMVLEDISTTSKIRCTVDIDKK